MSVVNSIIRAVLFGITADVLIKCGLISTRYFRRNKGSTDGYETNARLISDPLTHFDVEFQLLGAVDPAGTFLAQSTSVDSISREFQLFQNNGALIVVLGGFSNGTTTTLTTGLWRVKFDGVNIEIFKDGVGVETIVAVLGAATEPSATFTMCARHAGTNSSYGFHYEGVMANVRVRNSSGEITHCYPLDEPKGTDIIINRATALGTNLSTSNDPLDSVLIGGPTYSFYDLGSVVEGEQYLASCEINNYTGTDTIGFRSMLGMGDSISPRNRNSNGKIEFIFTATGSGVASLYTQAANQCTFSNISIRRADGYGTIVNGNDEDKGLFTQQANRDWLGEELVVNGGFDSDLSGWSAIGGGWSWNSGVASLAGSGSAQALNQSGVMSINRLHKIRFNPVTDASGIGYQDVGGNVLGSGSSGVSETEWLADQTTLSFKRSVGVVNGSIDNVSVKEVLRSA